MSSFLCFLIKKCLALNKVSILYKYFNLTSSLLMLLNQKCLALDKVIIICSFISFFFIHLHTSLDSMPPSCNSEIKFD